MSSDEKTSIEVASARREVDLAKASLRARVRVASETSQRLVKRVAASATPVLIVAGLGALLLGVGLYKLLRPRRAGAWRPPARRSLLREVVRAALISAAARIAAAVVTRMPVPLLDSGAARARNDGSRTY
jgi:hypothetical protein